MNFHRADVAVLKRLGVEDLQAVAAVYSQYRQGWDKLYGRDRPLPEALAVQVAVAAKQIAAQAIEVPQPPPPVRIDLGDGVARTIDEINGKRPTSSAAPKVPQGERWRKGRLLNYHRTRTETDPETGKSETFTEVVPALYQKKTKTGRLVIEVDGRNVSVAPDKVEDAEHETIKRPFIGNGPTSFRNESASAALQLVTA